MRNKIISNPKDRVGLMVFNAQAGSKTGSNTWKSCVFLCDLVEIDAPAIKSLKTLIEKCQKDPEELQRLFKPQTQEPNQIHEALRASLNRFKECVPKQASKRIFWITDNSQPFPGSSDEELKHIKTCMTISKDLSENGIKIEPFFVHRAQSFRMKDFYATLLKYHIPPALKDYEASMDQKYHAPKARSMSAWFEKLLHDASMREISKRSIFKIPFKIGQGLEIGVSGFVLISEEKRRRYIWVDPYTSTCEEVKVVTQYRDADSTAIVPARDIVNYFSIGDEKDSRNHRKVVFTNEEIEKARTLGLQKGLILFGFRPKRELKWRDHLKHAYFIYPNEDLFLGSTRVFSALLQSMAKCDKIGFGLLRARKGDAPSLVAIVPQVAYTANS